MRYTGACPSKTGIRRMRLHRTAPGTTVEHHTEPRSPLDTDAAGPDPGHSRRPERAFHLLLQPDALRRCWNHALLRVVQAKRHAARDQVAVKQLHERVEQLDAVAPVLLQKRAEHVRFVPPPSLI